MQDFSKEIDSFVFYRSFYEAISMLPAASKMKLFDAICQFALNKIEPNLSKKEYQLFVLIRPQLAANAKRRSDGFKGGRPKKETSGFENGKPVVLENENHRFEEKKPNVNGNVNVNVNVNGNGNENEECNNICDTDKKLSESPADSSKKTTTRKGALIDEEFLVELEKNTAYEGISIRKEYGKLQAWLLTPRGKGKRPTKTRFIGWLNRCNPQDDLAPVMKDPYENGPDPFELERLYQEDCSNKGVEP